MHIESIDHLVLTVADVEKTCDFYTRVLGMGVVTFGEGRKAITFGTQKINLHAAAAPIEPHALRPTTGAADLCFLTATPVPELLSHLRDHGVAVVAGPVRRTGARGPMRSVYLRDPDGNLIEVANYDED